MKNIAIIFLGLFCLHQKITAQEVNLSSNSTFSAPAGFIKQTDSSKLAAAKSANIRTLGLPDDLNRASYIYQDVILTLSSSDKATKTGLESLKKGLDEMGGKLPGFRSTIRVVNGVKALLVENPSEERIRFYATNNAGNSLVNGLLEFAKNNRQKALASVDLILRNIHFRD